MVDRFELFTVLVAKAGKFIRKLKTEEMAEYNLKSTHVSVLYYLYTMGESTATELCEMCAEDKANMSRSIEYLQELGYINFSEVNKRYKTPLSLTENGKRVGKIISDKITNVLQKVSESLTNEERQVFYKCFTNITNNLQEICNNYGDKND